MGLALSDNFNKTLFYPLFLSAVCMLGGAPVYAQPASHTSNVDTADTHVRKDSHSRKIGELGYRFKALDNPGVDYVGGQWETVQDSQGFIWFGGAGGVARYDGYTVKMYTNDADDPKSLSNNYVTDVVFDHDGVMWVSTLSGGINRYNSETDDFTRFMHDPENPNSLSYNWVWDIYVDEQGDLWLATDGGGVDKFSTKTGKFTHHRSEEGSTNSLANDHLHAVGKDSQGRLWFGTREHGVSRFDPESNTYTHFTHDPDDPTSISSSYIMTIYRDRRQQMWVGTERGLNRFDENTGSFVRYEHDPNNPKSIGGNQVRDVYEDSRGNLWVATDGGGLNILHQDTGTFERYQSKRGETEGLINNKVRTIFEDTSGGIWVGHYPAGVSRLDRYASVFKNYQHNPLNDNSLTHSDVLSANLSKDGNLWVGTEQGLNHIDRKSGKVTRYSHDPKDSTTLSANPVLSVVEDSYGYVWAGTWGGGVSRLDPASGRFIRFKDKEHQSIGLTITQGRFIFEDKKGTLWIGHERGVSRYDRTNNKFIHYRNNPRDENSILPLGVNHIFEDSEDQLWLGMDSGLVLMDRENSAFTRYVNDPDDPSSIGPGYISSIGEDKEGNLWAATGANGVNRLDKKSLTFSLITANQGLADDRVGAILTDENGDMWFGTGRGLSRYNLKSKSFKTYTNEHGLPPGNLYKRPACLNTPSGELIFGSSKGLTIFKPDDLEENPIAPPIRLIDFKVFNKSVVPGSKDKLLASSINHTEKLKLTHKHSVFSFEFAALNYVMPEKNAYAYMLEGFDQDWVMAGDRRTATYTNIDAGDYVFRVKGANNEGVWNEDGVALRISKLPPWWLSWWAYAIYVFTICAIVYNFVRSQQKKVKEAQEKAEMERAVVQRLEHLDKLKDDFLANTSHELRTPLNGIIGLADVLIDGAVGEVDGQVKTYLNMISVSGRRLAHLVNDILDFSKLKNKNIEIFPRPVDLHDIVDMVLTICAPSIPPKDLKLFNEVNKDLPAVMAEEDRLQQILYNLVGNAIKFTKSGEIKVSAEMDGGLMWIHVTDTGVGIEDGMRDKIFESFEQVENHEERTAGGTGLGLTITKQIVELHGGEIKLESRVGRGSVFSFSLPTTDQQPENKAATVGTNLGLITKCLDLYDAHLENQNGDTPAADAAVNTQAVEEQSVLQTGEDEDADEYKDNARFRVLIVDDDAVNRQVLLNQLRIKNYSIEMASSGQQALEILNSSPRDHFDIVLLDIMMPEMSGYEVCARLRLKYSIQELPVIFLTAKNLIADLADGFQVGANDFLTKPISLGELTSRVRTHLQLLDMNRNLEKKVKQRTKEVTMANKELQTLDSIVATIHQELRFDRLLEVVLNEAMTLFPDADRVTYWKLEKEDSTYKLIASREGDEEVQAHHNDDTESLSIPDLQNNYVNPDRKILDHITLLFGEHIEQMEVPSTDLVGCSSALCMSMFLEGELVGVLVLASKNSENAFVSAQASTMERFRTHVISALSKSSLVDLLESHVDELEDISVTDQLTGLRNRHYLYKHIDSDITNVAKKRQAILSSEGNHDELSKLDYVFFILDLDHFKIVNDTYGHVAGDKILQDMGELIRNAFRESDYCIRWGGEEFLVVARSCPRESAPAMAEKIRSLIERHEFVISEDTTLRKTCSIGFACYPFFRNAPSVIEWQQVLDVADICLYAAKKTKRNAWVGVSADENADDPQALVQAFIDAPANSIEDGSLLLSTSIEEGTSLVWE